ncbi:MAG: chemotaxis protein CheW [Pseudohongiellaceae bacterium]
MSKEMRAQEEKVKEELQQYLTFVLDEEEYGVPILSVRGIQGWEKTTPIPNSPNYVMGIINLRGEVVPIVDLRRRFGLEPVEYSTNTVVIVVRVEQGDTEKTVGLVVDAVADVHDIKNDDMRESPDFGSAIKQEFVRSLGLIEEKMVIILDIDRMVDWRELASSESGKHQQDSIAA